MSGPTANLTKGLYAKERLVSQEHTGVQETPDSPQRLDYLPGDDLLYGTNHRVL